MQVQLETLSCLERRLTIVLPMGLITTQVNERLRRLASSAKIQGFRPGKAPLKIVEMNYGDQVREEVMGEQVRQGFSRAVNEQKLRIAGYPRFEAVEQTTEDSFTFAAVFEVYPEVAIGDVSGKEIEKPYTPVGDAEVDKTIETLRKQRARYLTVDRAANTGDRVIVDFVGSIDGIEFEGGKAENFAFTLGEGQMLEAFEAGVVGLKESETREVEVAFPDDYHGKDVAGKRAVFKITVKNVAERSLPPIDSDFAKALGVAEGSVEVMRNEIRKNVEREVKRRLSARTKEQVMQALLEATEVQLPNALVELEVERLTEEARRNFKERGLEAKAMSLPPELFRKQAERRVALGLILAELVKANKLVASPEQIRARVEEFAQNYEHPDEVIQWYYADTQRLENPQSLVVEDLVVDFVLGKATVVEKHVPFETLMGTAA